MRRIPWFVRLLVGVGLLVLLLRRYPVSGEQLSRAFSAVSWPLVAGTLVLLFNQYVLSSIKWQAILRTHAIHLPLPRLVRSYLVGTFFSTFLPSSYGGDFVRVADVARASGRTFESAAAVALERLSGLVALTAVGAAASLYVAQAWLEPDFRTLALVLGAILLALIAAFLPGASALGTRLIAHVPIAAVRKAYGRIEAVVVHYRSRPALLAQLMLLSFAFQVMAYTIFYLYARALRIDLPWIYCLAFVPIVYLLEALPISVAGIGLREGGLIYFLSRLGLSSADAVSLSILVVSGRYLWMLVGGLLFALQPGARSSGAGTDPPPRRPSGFRRRLSRILRQVTPGFVATLYYFAKYRCVVHPRAMVQISSQAAFGRKTVVHRYARVILGTGEVRVGTFCSVQVFTTIAAGDSVIRIGDHVRIGPNCNIVGENHIFSDRTIPIHQQPNDPQGLVIEDDVWIGANCVVLPGVEIGRGCVIGAGSVVTKSLPPFSVAVGNPARVIRSR